MIIAVIIMCLGFFYIGFKLAMYAVRKHIKEISSEVDQVYKDDYCKQGNAFYDRIYNHFISDYEA